METITCSFYTMTGLFASDMGRVSLFYFKRFGWYEFLNVSLQNKQMCAIWGNIMKTCDDKDNLKLSNIFPTNS